MRQIPITILLAIIILSVVIVGFSVTNKNVDLHEVNNSEIKIISLSTDKENYHEGEPIEIEVLIYSSCDTENVKVTVSGIKSRFNRDYLSMEKTTNLTSGENKIIFSSNMPYCSSCTGVSYGTYKITVNVIQEDKTIATDSKDVELTKP